MARYRKKPVTIEAVRYLRAAREGSPDMVAVFDCGDDLPDWLAGALNGDPGDTGAIWFDHRRALKIGTLEGFHAASPGDFIIRGVAGEIYPCKPEIFAATYDEVA